MDLSLHNLGIDLGLILVVYAMTTAFKNLVNRLLVPFLKREGIRPVWIQWGPKLLVFWFVPLLCLTLAYLTVPEAGWKAMFVTMFKLWAGSLLAYNLLKNHFPIGSMIMDGK